MSSYKNRNRWIIVGALGCMPLSVLTVCGILILLLALAGAPFTPFATPPGKGPKAERGYQMSRPIIEALKVYYDKNGEYPDSLGALAPDYAGEIPPIVFRKTERSYELQFTYEGPGMNRCIYSPEKDWHCSGYY